ncbi:MAG TPA: DUF1326 domain-containing protein [Candidatus Thermoplasmatota archaeon]|jgi:hypothetical protein|nr:DUF1326 domain-containing protein [Candidatus Thermoplasmatota archaeon]
MAAGTTRWELDTEYIQSCNCDHGCPCNFNALPSHGNCEALIAWRVKAGHFGATKLDGVTYAWALWWPGAIHHGNGVSRLYVDAAASPEQAKAMEEIVSGRHGGGVYEVFAKTFAKVLPMKRAKIDFKFNGYDSSFAVEGVGEVRTSHIKNPVTGAAFEGEVVLPGGINFKRALVPATTWWMRDEDPKLLAHHENRSGFVATSKKANEGCIG